MEGSSKPVRDVGCAASVNIRAVVDEVLLEWEIPHTKLSAILTDNGSNIVAAFRSDMAVTLHDNEEDERGRTL